MQVPLQEEALETANGVQHLGTAQATDDADIAKLLHEAPARSATGEKPDYGRNRAVDKIL
jgi:hypothetical protein